jgi:predicted ABC-type ATPase
MSGGHDVPIGKIVTRYTRSLANCSIIAPVIDRTYVYDNSVDDAPARLLYRLADGRLVKSYGSINAWALDILQAIAPDESGSEG